MNLKCLFKHDFKFSRDYDLLAKLRKGWAGNAGSNYWQVFVCMRKGCTKTKHEKIGNWHEIKYCSYCKKQTRQETFIFSDVGGYGEWYGQGDGYIGWKCIMCGKDVKKISERVIDRQRQFMEGIRD